VRPWKMPGVKRRKVLTLRMTDRRSCDLDLRNTDSSPRLRGGHISKYIHI
jgi:hypothetical protein